MFKFFGKSKNDEIDEDDEEFEEAPKRRRKKKKEEVKPWTKRERVLVFAILVITVFSSLGLSVYARGIKLPSIPDLSVSVPHISLEETIIMEGSKPLAENTGPHTGDVDKIIEKFPGTVGVYFDLPNGGYGVNADKQFEDNKLTKIPVLVAFYYEVDQGGISPEDEYVLRNEDSTLGKGSINYEKLLEMAMEREDDASINIIKNTLGTRKISEAVSALDMKNTVIADKMTTPSDCASMIAKINAPNYLSQDSAERVMELVSKAGSTVTTKKGNELLVFENGSMGYSVITGHDTENSVGVIMSDEATFGKSMPAIEELVDALN